MRHLALLLALLPAPASAGHFILQVTLRDGKTVAGYVPEKRATFEGVTTTGAKVRVRFERPPSHAKREWPQEIVWDSERDVFVLRAPSWTGELRLLWDSLVLDAAPPSTAAAGTAEGELEAALAEEKRITVKGDNVAEAKVRFVDPATETVKPPRSR